VFVQKFVLRVGGGHRFVVPIVAPCAARVRLFVKATGYDRDIGVNVPSRISAIEDVGCCRRAKIDIGQPSSL